VTLMVSTKTTCPIGSGHSDKLATRIAVKKQVIM
jgi:hypothetical protein